MLWWQYLLIVLVSSVLITLWALWHSGWKGLRGGCGCGSAHRKDDGGCCQDEPLQLHVPQKDTD